MNQRLEKVIRGVFPIETETIDENWTSDDIPDWDSVGHLNLIMEIQKEFAIKIEIEEMFEIEKLGDINKLLEKRNVI
ncbi:MAG TPA: acyl carrier protein [Candidatus Deferrimicrobium sp.]|nr:acyl carrier protein [Candidatus Deferrimicrobium sp.]